MRRRDFIGVVCGAFLVALRHADAQKANKVWRIGVVLPTTPEAGSKLTQWLEQGLADFGYVQGRSILLSYQFAGPQPDTLRSTIASLLPQIDLLVAWGRSAEQRRSGWPMVRRRCLYRLAPR